MKSKEQDQQSIYQDEAYLQPSINLNHKKYKNNNTNKNFSYHDKYNIGKKLIECQKIIKKQTQRKNNKNGEIQQKYDYDYTYRQQPIRNEANNNPFSYYKNKKRQNNYNKDRINTQRLNKQIEKYLEKKSQIKIQNQKTSNAVYFQIKKQKQDKQKLNKKSQKYLQPSSPIQIQKKQKKQIIINQIPKKIEIKSQQWHQQSFKKDKHSLSHQTSQLDQAFQNYNNSQSQNSGYWIQPQNLLNALSLEDQSKSESRCQQMFIKIDQSISSVDVTMPFEQESDDFDKDLMLQKSDSGVNLLVEVKQNIEKVLNKIKQAEKYQSKDIVVEFVNIQNILEFKIKVIQLLYLNIHLNLTLEQQNIIVKDSIIPIQQLRKYIEVHKIQHTFPNIGSKEEQKIQFQLCNIKVPSIPQNEQKKQGLFIKKTKQNQKPHQTYIRIKEIKVKCMNCQINNTVPVTQIDNSVKLSCRQCNQKIEAKFRKISIYH